MAGTPFRPFDFKQVQQINTIGGSNALGGPRGGGGGGGGGGNNASLPPLM